MYDFDARCFYDPNRCCHVGWHPEIIDGVVSKDRRWLNGVRSRIRLALEEDVVVPVFLFYCRLQGAPSVSGYGHGGGPHPREGNELKDRALEKALEMWRR